MKHFFALILALMFLTAAAQAQSVALTPTCVFDLAGNQTIELVGTGIAGDSLCVNDTTCFSPFSNGVVYTFSETPDPTGVDTVIWVSYLGGIAVETDSAFYNTGCGFEATFETLDINYSQRTFDALAISFSVSSQINNSHFNLLLDGEPLKTFSGTGAGSSGYSDFRFIKPMFLESGRHLIEVFAIDLDGRTTNTIRAELIVQRDPAIEYGFINLRTFETEKQTRPGELYHSSRNGRKIVVVE